VFFENGTATRAQEMCGMPQSLSVEARKPGIGTVALLHGNTAETCLDPSAPCQRQLPVALRQQIDQRPLRVNHGIQRAAQGSSSASEGTDMSHRQSI
jgi:hypothetical protein